MKNFNNYSPKKMVQRIFNSAHQRKWQISEIIIFFAQLGELKKFACAERKLVCIWFQLLFSLSRSFWNDLWHFSWHLRLITFFFFFFFFFYSFLFLFLIIIFAAHAFIIFLRLFRWHFWFKKIVFSLHLEWCAFCEGFMDWGIKFGCLQNNV